MFCLLRQCDTVGSVANGFVRQDGLLAEVVGNFGELAFVWSATAGRSSGWPMR